MERQRLRNKKLTVWLSEEESNKLDDLSKKTSLTRSVVIRCLINNYALREYPKEEYEEFIKEIKALKQTVKTTYQYKRSQQNIIREINRLESNSKKIFFQADEFKFLSKRTVEIT